MNSLLNKLQPFSFARLRSLLAGVAPNPAYSAVNLSIGEPKHPTPALVTDALVGALSGLAAYPPVLGGEPLRAGIARWLAGRYGLEGVDPATQIIPVNGTKEALFSFAQVAIDPRADAIAVFPNPCYQVYEGAALLAGATPHYLEQSAENDFRIQWQDVPESVWGRTQLGDLLLAGQPHRTVCGWMTGGTSSTLRSARFRDRFGRVLLEIYPHESDPPLGALKAAAHSDATTSGGLMFSASRSARTPPGCARRRRRRRRDREALPALPHLPRQRDELGPCKHARSPRGTTRPTYGESRPLYREKFDDARADPPPRPGRRRHRGGLLPLGARARRRRRGLRARPVRSAHVSRCRVPTSRADRRRAIPARLRAPRARRHRSLCIDAAGASASSANQLTRRNDQFATDD